MMKKILITGATGFLGSALLRYIAENSEAEIVLLVRRYAKRYQRYQQITYADLDSLESNLGFNAIIHCAGLAHTNVNCSYQSAREYVSSNVILTRKLIDFANRQAVDLFVYISSINIYDWPKSEILSELCDTAASDLYTSSKLKCEKILKANYISSGTSFVIVQPSVIYDIGSFDNKGNIGKLFKFALKFKCMPIPIKMGTYSYTSIDNLCSFMLHILKNDNCWNDTYIVTDATPLSLEKFVERLTAPLKLTVVFMKIPNWLMRLFSNMIGQRRLFEKVEHNLHTDISKARRTGWVPKT